MAIDPSSREGSSALSLPLYNLVLSTVPNMPECSPLVASVSSLLSLGRYTDRVRTNWLQLLPASAKNFTRHCLCSILPVNLFINVQHWYTVIYTNVRWLDVGALLLVKHRTLALASVSSCPNILSIMWEPVEWAWTESMPFLTVRPWTWATCLLTLRLTVAALPAGLMLDVAHLRLPLIKSAVRTPFRRVRSFLIANDN